jgi:hypothetical protein
LGAGKVFDVVHEINDWGVKKIAEFLRSDPIADLIMMQGMQVFVGTRRR